MKRRPERDETWWYVGVSLVLALAVLGKLAVLVFPLGLLQTGTP